MNPMVSWEDIATLASRLEPSDRLRLVERIVHDMAAAAGAPATGGRRSWREIRGLVAHPFCGEDAQSWVSRGRQESDASRDAGMRTTP